MSYKKADMILPADLLQKVQEYIDGEYIYIPRTAENKQKWGAKTLIRQELKTRNDQIYSDYLSGSGLSFLAQKYYLSLKSIQRIVGQQKRKTN